MAGANGDCNVSNEEFRHLERLIATTELPQDIRDRILRVVRGSHLDGERQADVAKELIAHFDDGLAAGHSARELLESFGDDNVVARQIENAGSPSVAPTLQLDHMWKSGDPFVMRLLRDLRYAMRRVLQNPGFTFTAILSLAIGIGANTAIFSLVNAILLRPVPLQDPETLVDAYISRPEMPYNLFSIPDYMDLREDTRDVFEGVSGTMLSLVQVERDADIEMVPVEMVTGNFFPLIGVSALLGRTLLPEDDVSPGAHPVAMVGHSYWKNNLGADPNVVGSEVRLSGRLYTIVGVAPEEYLGKFRGIVPGFFLPLMMVDEVQAGGSQIEARGNHSFFVRARLEPGVSIQQALVSTSALANRLKAEHPRDWNADDTIRLVPTADVIIYPPFDRFVRAAAWLLMSVVGLVLLITCANLASFQLARATDRRKEIAVRLALGATRKSLVGQLISESVLLGILGGIGGVAVGLALLRLLLAAELPLPVPVALDLDLDATVLGFSFLISVFAGVLFGLAPALQSTRPDVASTLKDETAGGGQASRLSLRNALIVGQVAVSFLLLIGAGLFLRSFQATQAVDPGFGNDPAAIMTMALPSTRYSEEEGRSFLRGYFDRIGQIPGVQAVGLTNNLHLNTLSTNTTRINVAGVEPPPDRDGHDVDRKEVDAGFFGAAGIRIVQGRNFNTSDREDSPSVAIVSQALANRFWPGQDAVGRIVERPHADDLVVVGIASDAKVRSLGEAPRSLVYLPFSQVYQNYVTVVARTALNAERLALQMLATLRELDPDAWVWEAKTMEEHLAIVLLPARLSAVLLTVFAALAVTLASIGLYGVVSYAVSQRTREMGIRMSLGADAGRVIGMLTGSGMRLVAVGAVLGLGLALVVARLLSQLLFGVGAFDPVTFVAVPALLTTVALLAAYFPARKASRVDPVSALRAE